MRSPGPEKTGSGAIDKTLRDWVFGTRKIITPGC